MVRFFTIIGFCFLLVYSQNTRAQRLLTLEEAIATALQNNYDIQLAKNDSLSAAIDWSYRNAVFLPTLNSTLATTWNNNNQKQTLADGTQRQSKNIRSHNMQGNVVLNWVLFDGFKMFATRDKAAALLQSGSYTIKEQIVSTVANVIRTYYNIARQQQLVKATDVQINLNSDRAKLAQYKLDIGTGAKPDVLQSKVDLNEQKALRLEQEVLIEQLKEQLAQAMNLTNGAQFDVPDTIPVNYNIALGDMLQDIDHINPSLLLARSNIEIAQYTLKQTRGDLYPTVSFNSAYNYNRINNKKVINQFSPLFNQSNGYNYGFTASIPIFNQFRVRRQIKQDELNISYQKLNYENQRSQLTLAMFNAFKSYEQQKRSLKLAEENILLARENVDIVLQTYRLGMATLVQLREAQLSLAQAYDRLIAARYNAKLSETDLRRLRGDIVR